jgi:GTP-binding protein
LLVARKRPLVAIVGRPNVGKSTLFNRMVGERKAVVHHLPGMTRDRHYSDAQYRMRPFTVIDTGGYEDSVDSTILNQMRMQSLAAMSEADAVIFLADFQEPDDPVDAEIISKLRASGKKFFLAVNKCDKTRLADIQAMSDFSRYGLEVYPLSGKDGFGVYDLLDDVTADFEQWDPDEEEEDLGIINVAIVGRQNVGKSTLLNRLLGEERVIANPIGGTTRDAIDAEITVDGQPFVVIDTAGIRRRGKIEKGPEALSVHSSFRAIDRAHVVILVVDGDEGLTAQDAHVAGYVLNRRRACIIAVNKWDMVPNREVAYANAIKNVRQHFSFIPWAPVLTLSALTGQRTHKLWDLVKKCAENFRKRYGTAELNLVLKKAVAHVSPPTHRGNAVSIKYVVQTGTMPPLLTFFVNNPHAVHFSYKRYLANQFMAQLGLEGTPMGMKFREKSIPGGWDPKVRAEAMADKRGPRLLDVNEQYYAGNYDEGEERLDKVDLSDITDQEDEEGEEMVFFYDLSEEGDEGDEAPDLE